MELLVPDAGELFRQWATSRPRITALVAGRVSLTLSGAYPALRYALLPGRAGGGWEYLPELQVECWGDVDGDETALLLARTLRAETEQARGLFPAGYLVGVDVTVEPYSSPDPTTGRARYLLTVQLTTGWEAS